jgi:TPR repeat protein
VANDEEQAALMYRLADDQGNSSVDGIGVTKDEREAVHWYRLAAD